MPEPTPVFLQADDLEALLEGISAFAQQELATRSLRPEHALSADDFSAITVAAQQAGLLDNGASGYGLWSECSHGFSPSFTLTALQRLAQGNVSAAWHLHSLALAGLAAQFAQLSIPENTVFSVEGTQGIGRSE